MDNKETNDLKDKRISALRASITNLEAKRSELEAELASITTKLKDDPNATVERHIRLLHDYNEIKDVGQGLMGLIADSKGVRQVDVEKEFGVGDQD
ncbi:uncharacterized protein N7515_002983 [Penicillium bovifimosum]|uniref:DNA repair protein Swi5/Sae3 n=1 Tax=Penicillium bovifimosum TaxID=126998 RepID=A0A9W9L9Y1_9EURO|nr:uncharacterized protein N7515_002983 [Penicillium bovifimosum]KAJ5144196.1 hypothetical protein N7515_002983 [Penicillium bovifimosum]